MRYIFLILVSLIFSCGSTFLADPPPAPEFEDCVYLTKYFISHLDSSLIPLPFNGEKVFYLFTDKPEYWHEFEGTIHLKSIKWNVEWIKYLAVIADNFIIASYEDEEWQVSSRINLKPLFQIKEDNPNRLVFELKMNAKGTKPSNKTVIEVEAEFYFCGENQDLMLL